MSNNPPKDPNTETVSIAVLATEYRLSERQVRYRLASAGVVRSGNGKWPLWACVRALNAFASYSGDDQAADLTDEDRYALEEAFSGLEAALD